MALKVITQTIADLSEAEKLKVSDNGAGKEYAGYLRVLHNGKCIGLYSDAMEREDAVFGRDLSWIKYLVLVAYQLGQEDGKE